MIRSAASALIIFTLLALSGCQSPTPPPPDIPPVSLTQLWELTEGLSLPESVVYDSERDVLYVSNMAGPADEKNGTGYLARVSPDGTLLDSVWIAGLNAPKGLDIQNGMLYAADIDELLVIDLTNANVTARYPAEGAQFLNDVSVHPSGDVYVTDSRTNRIHRLRDSTFTLWMEGNAIQAINGVFAEEERILVAAHGGDSESPGANRYLIAIDLKTKKALPVRDEASIGALDGIKPDGTGGYFLSDWAGGKLYHFTAADGPTSVLTLTQGTADIEYLPESKRLFIPVMMSDRLMAYSAE